MMSISSNLLQARSIIKPNEVVNVSELYIYAAQHPDSYGIGFFINFNDGTRAFVYQEHNDPDNSTPQIQGTDIGNIRKAILPVIQGNATMDMGESAPRTLYVKAVAGGLCVKTSDKSVCTGGHGRLKPDAQLALGKGMLTDGVKTEVAFIPKSSIKVKTSDLFFGCENIINVSDITQTTGGSVYIFAIDFNNGKSLNVNAVIGRPDSERQIREAHNLVKERCVGTKQEIQVKWHILQDKIYTQLGTFSGPITNPANLTVH